ncbi:hypothetical protein BHM03_00013163, partial [Ensete ventricosum]
PCALVRPWSSRDGVDARLDGWIPRTSSRGLVAGVVERGSGVDFCKEVGSGAEAYIVGVVGHSYLATLLPLWLTMSSYPSTTPAVLAVRQAPAGKGVDLTCVRSVVRSTVRPLGCRPYLCQVGRTIAGAPILTSDQLPASGRPRRQASCPRAYRRDDQVTVCHINSNGEESSFVPYLLMPSQESYGYFDATLRGSVAFSASSGIPLRLLTLTQPIDPLHRPISTRYWIKEVEVVQSGSMRVCGRSTPYIGRWLNLDQSVDSRCCAGCFYCVSTVDTILSWTVV